ncbi:hypothetical protein ACFE04_018687 [Oxalis oulophora]
MDMTMTSSNLASNPKGISDVVDFGAIGDGKNDDTQAFSRAWKSVCEGSNEDGNILHVPNGKSFILHSHVFKGPCQSNVIFQIIGNITAPSRDKWRLESTVSTMGKNASNCWICFYDIVGLTVNGSGTIDGQGDPWWNGEKERSRKPRALHFNKCQNVRLSGLTHINSPRNHISFHMCNNVTISSLNIIAPGNSPNTDGIDISYSNSVHLDNSSISTGDDCVAINANSSQIYIRNITCGPGHGISIGSLGDDENYDTVEEVYVSNCTFNETENGARIKTIEGASGYARNIFFENITLVATKNPIIINQFYTDSHSHSHSHGINKTHGQITYQIQVSNVTFLRFQGTSASKEAITLNCVENGCEDIFMDQINITSTDRSTEIFSYCKNANGTSDQIEPKNNVDSSGNNVLSAEPIDICSNVSTIYKRNIDAR